MAGNKLVNKTVDYFLKQDNYYTYTMLISTIMYNSTYIMYNFYSKEIFILF